MKRHKKDTRTGYPGYMGHLCHRVSDLGKQAVRPVRHPRPRRVGERCRSGWWWAPPETVRVPWGVFVLPAPGLGWVRIAPRGRPGGGPDGVIALAPRS